MVASTLWPRPLVRQLIKSRFQNWVTMLESTYNRFNWQDYFELCKPKVVALILFTALVGMFMSTDGLVPFDAWFWGLLGIGLAASASAVFNHCIDEKIDAKMERTNGRPLPKGNIIRRQAVTFAFCLTTLSMIVLVTFVNILTTALTLASVVGYTLIYTMFLKHTTPLNIVLGGAAGAASPVLGWTAVMGKIHGEALLLFLIIFIWTPPHFWAFAIKRRDEYAKVGVPMLPVTHGIAFTKLHVLLYTILLVVITIIPFLVLMSGMIYLAGAIVLGAGFFYYSIKLYISEGDQYAMETFVYSIFYLSALFSFLILDHYTYIFLN